MSEPAVFTLVATWAGVWLVFCLIDWVEDRRQARRETAKVREYRGY